MQIKPIKSLGQNFLLDKNIQNKIIDNCSLDKEDIVLEIGPGRGELTKFLVEKAKLVLAVEIDPRLSKLLEENLIAENLKIYNKDILKLDFKKIFADLPRKIKVIGNIPYYISTPIIEKLLEHKDHIDQIFLTVQKEFASRVVAPPGSKTYGSLSCYLQYYTDPKILFIISRGCFSPRPKVDSCLLRLTIRDQAPVKVKDEKRLFLIIRQAFNQRRKTLRNSLSEVLEKGKLEDFFNKYNINKNIRPEELSLADFAMLANL